jgi:hypothetical protein
MHKFLVGLFGLLLIFILVLLLGGDDKKIEIPEQMLNNIGSSADAVLAPENGSSAAQLTKTEPAAPRTEQNQRESAEYLEQVQLFVNVHRKGLPIADARVTHMGVTILTDRRGVACFQRFARGGQLLVETQEYPCFVTVVTANSMAIDLVDYDGVPGEVRVKGIDGVDESAVVRVHLLDQSVYSSSSLWHEMKLVGVQKVDTRGISRFKALPRREKILEEEFLYAVVEYGDGSTQEGFLKEKWSRKERELYYFADFQQRSGISFPLKLLRREKNGVAPVAECEVYYRVDQAWRTPWHKGTTNASGFLDLKEGNFEALQVVARPANGQIWCSFNGSITFSGSAYVGILDNKSKSISLEGEHAIPKGVRFSAGISEFKLNVAGSLQFSSSEIPAPLRGVFGWQAIKRGEPCTVDSGIFGGTESQLLIRASPGGNIIHIEEANASEFQTISLGKLCLVEISTGVQLANRVSARLIGQGSLRGRSYKVERSGRDKFNCVVPPGDYIFRLYPNGSAALEFGPYSITRLVEKVVLAPVEKVVKINFTFLGKRLDRESLGRVEINGKEQKVDESGSVFPAVSNYGAIRIRLGGAGMEIANEPPRVSKLLFLGTEFLVSLGEGNTNSLEVPFGTLVMENARPIGAAQYFILRKAERKEKGSGIRLQANEPNNRVQLAVGDYVLVSSTSGEEVNFNIRPGEDAKIELRP